jgi:hypothetical protein
MWFAAPAAADAIDDIGYTLLLDRLGTSTPDGSGVRVAQVEVHDLERDYAPNPGKPDFSGKTINHRNDDWGTTGASDHATQVAYFYYGLYRSAAPGVMTIDAYRAYDDLYDDDWLQDVLKWDPDGPKNQAPAVMDASVVNHSWEGSCGSDSRDREALRRADYLGERDGVIMVAGVANGDESTMPRWWASGYNSIAVGTTYDGDQDGNLDHSPGPTNFDVAGRCKPDLVAPNAEHPFRGTSYSTPLVAGFAASLAGEADDRGWWTSSDPRQPVVVKSILMAGVETLDGWTTSGSTQPLDYQQGAGMLRADRAYRVFDAGDQGTSSGSSDTKASSGWDYAEISTGTDNEYYLDLAHPAAEFTINLTWLRRHTGNWINPGVTLDNLDLRFYDGTDTLLGTSNSTIDNVEHLRFVDLDAGAYRIAVTLTTDNGASDEEYGLAWFARWLGDVDEDGSVIDQDMVAFNGLRVGGQSGPGYDADAADWDRDGELTRDDGWLLAQYLGASALGDAELDGDVDSDDLAIWVANKGSTGTSWLTGDFDFDGDTDVNDLILWYANSGSESASLEELLLSVSVPEPASITVLLVGSALVLLRRRRG